MALVFIAVFISCDKSETLEDDDNGLFVPQLDMTQSQIVELLEEAIKNTNSSDEITYTFRDSTNRNNSYPYFQLSEPSITDHFYSLNKQAQKSLEVHRYHNDGSMIFRYVDGFNNYDGYIHLEFDDKLDKSMLDDMYWLCLDYHTETIGFTANIDRYTWTIEGKSFIGKLETLLPLTSGHSKASETLEMVLTKNLKINNFYSNNQMSNLYYEREFSCAYIANPMMLQGYSISDFNQIPQYEVKIIWEDETENVFYTYYDENSGACIFHSSMVHIYFPNKFLRLFYDANYTDLFDTAEIVTENMTLYAKWVEYINNEH